MLEHGIPQKRRGLFVCLLLFYVLLGFSVSVSAGEVTILTPINGSVIYARKPVTHLVVKVTNRVDLMQLELEGDGAVLKPTGTWSNKKNHYVHFTMLLKPGRNEFLLNPGEKIIKVSYKPLRTLINIDFEAPSVYRFHRKEVIPTECGLCHTEKYPARSGIDAEEQRLLYGVFAFSPECYSCHQDQVSGSKWQHGPAANLLCNTCHKVADKGGKIAIPGGKMIDLCSKCHVYARAWSKMNHMHGPTGTGDCTICHNPTATSISTSYGRMGPVISVLLVIETNSVILWSRVRYGFDHMELYRVADVLLVIVPTPLPTGSSFISRSMICAQVVI